MKKYIFLLTSFLFVCFAQAQPPKKALPKVGDNPIFFVDSIKVDKPYIQQMNPKQVASLSVYTEKEAFDLLGEAAKDGVIYIETIPFAKKRFWTYFKSKSVEYAELVPTVDSDSTIQYILNEKVLKKDYEGNLSSINDKVFKGIKIISKEELIKDYQITDKAFGVLVLSDVPPDLDKGKEKF